jgi:hypothetical protein
MKQVIIITIGIMAVLLISGCTQTNTENGDTAKQISMENLIAAGNIKINGNYPDGSIGNATIEGCKQEAHFSWIENISMYSEVPIMKASFGVIECYNENATKDYLDWAITQSPILPITYTISTVEVKKIEYDSGQTYLIWREGKFFMMVTGETLGYAQQVAEALIDSYK